ncbi:MAG: ATP-binding protein [Ruminococcaceae bacterium]|nr:ATP-binding protein [Oscillospiraceae bacterium]
MLTQYRKLLLNLKSLTTFRSVLQLPAVRALTELLNALNSQPEEAMQAYGVLLYEVREAGFQDLSSYLADHLRFDESAFGRACAKGANDALFSDAAEKDVRILSEAATLDFDALKACLAESFPEHADTMMALPVLKRGEELDFSELVDSFVHNGVGIFARGRAFLWENGALSMVRNPDHIDEAQMIGYTWQRQEVMKNTAQLLAGKTANNVLLHGDSGTGKSATIKSLINVPEFYNLRVVEVAKSSLGELTQLVRLVSGHTQKFILYIDDLTFEREDKGYSALKTALEGGLENRPENVAIYATSNRRHLVRETFADRQGGDVHREETIQERTSLSERFGLRIVYLSLNQKEYLNMVEIMARQAGIEMDPEQLGRKANQWEIQHGGRTPRVARQFIDSLHEV